MNQLKFKGRVASKSPSDIQGLVFRCVEDLKKIPSNSTKVFVAQDTAVSDIPMIKEADAVLTEHGGLLSHAAIVCRELGIPCIVAINNIYHNVQVGDVLSIDFNLGEISLVKTQ